MNHYEITWGIGSTGDRCQFFEQDVPEDLGKITCIDCLRQLVVDYKLYAERMAEQVNYYEEHCTGGDFT